MKVVCSSCFHNFHPLDEQCSFCRNEKIVYLCEKGHILYEYEDPLSPIGTNLMCQVCFIEQMLSN